MNGRRDGTNEVRSARAGAERAHASAVGGCRSRSGRPRGNRPGRARDRHVADADRARHRGTEIGGPVGCRAHAARRRRSQAYRGHRPDAGLGLGRAAGADHRRRAGRQPPAVDLQEREQAHRRVAGAGAPGGSSCGQRVAAPARLHPAGEPQEHRRRPTPGSGCAVQLPQRAGAQCSAAGSRSFR